MRSPRRSTMTGMAMQPGRNEIGPDRGSLVLHTFRDGLAAQAGHDLTIDLTRWIGALDLGDDLTPVSLDVRIDMASFVVRDGTGGVKALTDKDKREIAETAQKVLSVARYPEGHFAAATFPTDGAGEGTLSGTLTLCGVARPFSLAVREVGPSHYQATGSVVQSQFGI